MSERTIHDIDNVPMGRRIKHLVRISTNDRFIASYLTSQYGVKVTVAEVAKARRLHADKPLPDYRPLATTCETSARLSARKGSAALADKLAAYRIGDAA